MLVGRDRTMQLSMRHLFDHYPNLRPITVDERLIDTWDLAAHLGMQYL